MRHRRGDVIGKKDDNYNRSLHCINNLYIYPASRKSGVGKELIGRKERKHTEYSGMYQYTRSMQS